MNFTVKFITNVFICFCQKINAEIRYKKDGKIFIYTKCVSSKNSKKFNISIKIEIKMKLYLKVDLKAV